MVTPWQTVTLFPSATEGRRAFSGISDLFFKNLAATGKVFSLKSLRSHSAISLKLASLMMLLLVLRVKIEVYMHVFI
ncbi:hypothetical protein SBDP1_1560006 [Syntrophobacter sp. SbD1]|nr:hypothetical protein SBDP1_1560006 [Syntrophobacter sp. SbD1]